MLDLTLRDGKRIVAKEDREASREWEKTVFDYVRRDVIRVTQFSR